MSKKKIFNISDTMDEMLKETAEILDMPEASIMKQALLMYLMQVTGRRINDKRS